MRWEVGASRGWMRVGLRRKKCHWVHTHFKLTEGVFIGIPCSDPSSDEDGDDEGFCCCSM